jgi:murein DD-endopeptidase MepM/ murein hydrolase activator NlpD
MIVAVVSAGCMPIPAAASGLAVGAQGRAVDALQLDLARHGFPSGAIDGRFGPRLAGAVRRFQRSVGLPADGVVGQATLAALRQPSRRATIPLGWPLLAPVGDRFGVRGSRFHAGIDLLAPSGTTVLAAAPGRVTWAHARAGGLGLLVVVAHPGGVRTLYAHLETIAVHVGEWVAGGTELGLVGATGDATGPHLHFEVRVQGAAVDPLTALVRLDG